MAVAKRGPLRKALETTVRALALPDRHAAQVESARFLADALDALGEPDDALVREYRMALAALIEAGADADGDTDKIQLTFRTPRIRG